MFVVWKFKKKYQLGSQYIVIFGTLKDDSILN